MRIGRKIAVSKHKVTGVMRPDVVISTSTRLISIGKTQRIIIKTLKMLDFKKPFGLC
jgi:hypothetical protein